MRNECRLPHVFTLLLVWPDACAEREFMVRGGKHISVLIAKILQRRHLIKLEAQAVPDPKSHGL